MVERNPEIHTEAIARTMAALESRSFIAHLAADRREAMDVLVSLIPKGSEVYINSSETLTSIGFPDFMNDNPEYTNLSQQYHAEEDPDRIKELRRRILTTDFFIGSVQAVAETGEVFIASASGSQLAPYVYGPAHVILVVGTQKIVPTFEEAMARVRGLTLEKHHEWMEGHGRSPIPIGKLGIIEHELEAGRLHVLLINESLGW